DNTIFSPFELYSLSSLESINGIITNAKKIYDCFEDPSISFFIILIYLEIKNSGKNP
ncbi:unnamed protein product, partial [marine sediment metagenome]